MRVPSLVPFVAAVLCGTTVHATPTSLRVNPSATSGQPGQLVEFTVHTSTSEDIGALQFTLDYNAALVTFVSAAVHPSMPPGFAIINVNPNLPGPYAPGTNKSVLVQVSGNGIDQSFTGEQDVVNLTFRFATGACGTTPMTFETPCPRTHLATLGLIPICNPVLFSGTLTDCSPSAADDPVTAMQLFENYPNPFNPTTTIRFELAAPGDAKLRVFDVIGRTVRLLLSENTTAGPHEVLWNGRDDAGRVVPSGVYYYELTTSQGQATRRMLLLK